MNWLKSLWIKTKYVAVTYTWTFIAVLLLNQLLFFGFCLIPICILAAMPHCLAITVVIGTWLHKGRVLSHENGSVPSKIANSNNSGQSQNQLERDAIKKSLEAHEVSFEPVDEKAGNYGLKLVTLIIALSLLIGGYYYFFKRESSCGDSRIVTASSLIVREQPTTSSNKISSIPFNTQVCIKDYVNGWLRVDGGWISEQYTKPVDTSGVSQDQERQEVSANFINTKNCSESDQQYLRELGVNYAAEEAYSFGRQLQQLIERRDLHQLFMLVEDELKNGPRKSYIKNRTFNSVFSEKWRNEILADQSPCTPVGWRGFMLASGNLWFDKIDNKWQITSINGAEPELGYKNNLPTGWSIDGKIVPPQCFITEWLSSDNMEAYEEYYGIHNKEDFRKNTGKYLGKEIYSVFPIPAPWGDNKKSIPIVTFAKQCLNENHQVELVDDVVKSSDCFDDSAGSCTSYTYTVLGKISTSACSELAPNLPGMCTQSLLIEISNYSGGSMGWYEQYYLYGEFVLSTQEKIIAPLKKFNKKNNALNFLDSYQF